ncbi:hypothetical protein ACOMHN_058382 [Nucella lapillus]
MRRKVCLRNVRSTKHPSAKHPSAKRPVGKTSDSQTSIGERSIDGTSAYDKRWQHQIDKGQEQIQENEKQAVGQETDLQEWSWVGQETVTYRSGPGWARRL